MRLSDFVAALHPGRGVRFGQDGPKLAARAESLSAILADALSHVLGPESEIHSGWQTGELRYDWSGDETWWLVLDDQLLKAQPALRPEASERRYADVSISLLPLAEARPLLTLSYVQDWSTGGTRLFGARARLSISDESLDVAGDLGEVLHFVRHLRESIQRANRGSR